MSAEIAVVTCFVILIVGIPTAFWVVSEWGAVWKRHGELRAKRIRDRVQDACTFGKDGEHRWDQWSEVSAGRQDRKCLVCNAVTIRRVEEM